MDFTAVLAQIKPKLGCIAANLKTIEGEIAKAMEAGADLVVFPESYECVPVAESQNTVIGWSSTLGVPVLMGVYHRRRRTGE